MLAEKAEYPVKMIARLLEVSRLGFYSWLANGAPTDEWGHVHDAVKRVWLESDRRFGARMVNAFLPPELGFVTLYRVRKCMRELGIRGVTPNAEERTTIPDEGAPLKPDLVACDFTSPVPTYKLVGDITYLCTGQGRLSLATVIDLNTRMAVGWACVRVHVSADIVVSALGLARRRGHKAEGPSSTAAAAASAPRGSGVVGQGRRRGALVWPHQQPPRQRGGRVLLRGPQERDVLPPLVCHARGGGVRRGRLHRVLYNRRRSHSTIGYRVPADVMDESFERFESALSEPREVLWAA
ncbi:IS3 family transposase [Atopobium sp. BS2]|jgi:integrase/recombinase (fragment)|uniref:IS3 family transposase n=1 Tax=Atopobium sp. BS2 TaxID=936550 RepID=UPI000684E35D|nr:IS3 family transposase [Atopobium sp. BS2]